MKKLLLLLSLFLTLSLSGQVRPGIIASQRTINITNIHYVSTSGNNGNNGHSQAQAWATLAYAEANATVAGDIIALKKGDTFAITSLGINHGGSVGSPIIWDGSLWGSGANAIIQKSANNSYAQICIYGCQYVTFQNITVDGNSKQTYAGVIVGGYDGVVPSSEQDDEQYITIQDCVVHDIGRTTAGDWCPGILIMPWSTDIQYITVQRNVITDIDNHGIAWYSGKISEGAPAQYAIKYSYCGYNTITKCGLLEDLVADAILITLDVQGLIVEHNIITQGAAGKANGIGFSGGDDGDFPTGTIVRYNDIRLVNQSPIYIECGGAITLNCYYNLLYTSAISGSAGITIALTTDLSYAGAAMNFYNNTICVDSGNAYADYSNQTGVCTFKNNLLSGIGAGQYAHTLINIYDNNTSTVHSNNLLYRTEATNCFHIDYNGGATHIYRNNTISGWEATAKVTDPLLTNRAGFDWTLQAGSPAIGAGTNIATIPQFDYTGAAVANPPEIGAYEK